MKIETKRIKGKALSTVFSKLVSFILFMKTENYRSLINIKRLVTLLISLICLKEEILYVLYIKLKPL